MDVCLSLFNTLTRSVESIGPGVAGRFHIYSCGPTVYRYVHLGNLRTFILSDLVSRAATYAGFDVRLVMNITDVGHLADEILDRGPDRMLLAAETEGKSPSEIAEFYTSAFFEDIEAVGVRRADHYPRASLHVPQMIELIEKLIDRGHAYVAGGNVYYDVTTFDDFGKMSGNTLGALRAGHRGHDHDENKRHTEDFLLWRRAGARRLLKFDSPWGEGFPGWHIECSAMSLHHLGEEIDVHTGGIDLIFPHHENEMAQSEGVAGRRVVKVWVHGGPLLMGGKKMAKSKSNDVRAVHLRRRGIDPLAFRYLCLTARYRRQLNFSWDALEAADTALERLRRRLAGADPADASGTMPPRAVELSPRAAEYDAAFAGAILDDLSTPKALEVLHRAIADPNLVPSERHILARSWDGVLGLGLISGVDSEYPASSTAPPPEDRMPDADSLVEERAKARRARDFAEAGSSIRPDLDSQDIEQIDTLSGTAWRKRKR